MRYIMRVVEKPVLYGYRKNNPTHAYTTEKLHKYRERLPRRYVRPSSLTKSLESHYIPRVKSNLLYKKAQKTVWKNSYLFPKAEIQSSSEKTCWQYLDGWKRLFCQHSMACSENFKEVDIEKSKKIGFELMELKTNGDDKCYSKEMFLDEVEMAGGHICLLVEKQETVEFICRLCCELIQNNVERGWMKK